MAEPSLSPAYRSRVLDRELNELIVSLPAIALAGAKFVGKTATALRRAETVWSFDDEAHVRAAVADPDALLMSAKPILIDEWQRFPPIWDRVRRAVDAHASSGSFLLAGSASPRGTGTHSGAGRIVSLRMRPMSLAERWPGEATISLPTLFGQPASPLTGATDRRLDDYLTEILGSGFPGLRDLPNRARMAQLDGYLSRILDRDFDELGEELRRPDALRRWLRAYAAATATTASYEKIRLAAEGRGEPASSRGTVERYREVLRRLFQLDPVPAWAPLGSRLKRVSFPEKHHLADPALAARLLGVGATDLVRGVGPDSLVPRDGGLLGALFESLVTLSLRVYAQAAGATVEHFRTSGGEREVDLIVRGPAGKVVAVEVKLTAAPEDRDGRHLNWLEGEIGDELADKVLITAGPLAYRRNDGVAVVPAALLGP